MRLMLLTRDQLSLEKINMKKLQNRIAEKTLNLLISTEWKLISIEMICKKLKLNKKKISPYIKNKHDLIKNISHYFDDQILISLKSIEKSSSRDMLFEILMMRFDLLNKYRESILKILHIFRKQPNNFIFLLPSFINSISIIAENANIQTAGLKGSIRVKGILIIYFSTFLIWLKDESSTLDKTMTYLDNYLKRAENLLNIMK